MLACCENDDGDADDDDDDIKKQQLSPQSIRTQTSANTLT